MSKKGNKNAFKHGAYAKKILLPNESAEDFEQQYQAFRLQYNPVNDAQDIIVRELTGIQWVKDRLNGSLRQTFQVSELVVSEIGESPMDIITHSAKSAKELINSTTELVWARSGTISQASLALLKDATPDERERVLNAAHQLAESGGECAAVLQGIIRAANGLMTIARNPLYHNIDDVIKLQADLDRRFDNAVKRLINMKEIGRVYGVKELPEAEPTSLAPDQPDGDTAENSDKLKDGEKR